MRLTGVDGCKAGWIAISQELREGGISAAVHARFSELVKQPPESLVIAVDIPIGLTAAGPRRCDRLARLLLGVRHTTIFPAPIRAALRASKRVEASAITQRIDGRGVGAQAWNIYRKVAEVDDFLRDHPGWREKVFEVHPEVSFRAWNAGVPLAAPKKTAEGRQARQQLISSRFGAGLFEQIRNSYPKKLVADDDIADAWAALWTAARIHAGEAVFVPDPPEVDPAGLRMAITY